MDHDTPTVTELAEILNPERVDWEPRIREQPYRPTRRRNRVGL